MKAIHFLVLFVVLASASSFAFASDPSPLQDFCLAINDYKNSVLQGSKACHTRRLLLLRAKYPRNTSNPVGSTVTPVNVAQIAGLNTLGVSLVHIDYVPYGQNPPHTHPRASEVLVVQEGTLYVGFVTSNPENKLFTRVG
ncbi:hypothetical protein Dsin_033034 [Dipteronia sinensis]|uniref:Cupin type-1 domain-containing protein n=1 Tax=Dipteronia sinensis TaxID=43782 RepID=A0AAE0DJ86_9ROSI|nr:hypothetical protein Dsin_033034 [Dipteronia sinensis]